MIEKPKRKKFGGRKPGSLNKSKSDIRELLDANIDFSALILKLNELGHGVVVQKTVGADKVIYTEKPDSKAIKILLEYRFGMPQQKIEHTGDMAIEKHIIKLPDGSKIEI